ncbi:MAG: PorP/SprF family type IX secretion system membrane protein [Lewinellaceae bacterium]|nr:PorP/SprF family type IX secretion system membrane protein [Lewinellaceae bacterium]
MTKYLLIVIFSLGWWVSYSQQLPNSSCITETRTVWNPAFTAVHNDMIVDGFFRMQWIGFTGAPLLGFTNLQYPFVKQNMSAGAGFVFDKTGPVSKIGLQLNYAYKLKEFLSRNGQLSLGVGASFSQYSLNTSGVTVNEVLDPFYNNIKGTSFFPSISGGFYYTSNVRQWKGNGFFVGASLKQIWTTDVLINDFDQVRQRHVHFNIGGRIVSYNSAFEPMIMVNYVNPDIIDVLYNLKYELEDTFWAGLGYGGSKMVSIQGGVILPDVGGNHSQLKIGALGNYHFGSTVAKAGPSVEMYIGYYLTKK